MDYFDYRKILALVVIAVVVWIVWVFYNVGRESVVKKFDHIRSKWKIMLFWLIVIVLGVIYLYYFES
ncbi:hypothetical protein HN958_04005 [Candidatus Falkowbacteria bacterium]|jgi:hypothetical protein|nr:hypothetical protein [Candidatus Falkowbacteria bacterium]MBT7007640.1 hypothetical protein [Candidatus Falkowbacteria bacterium]